MAVSQISRIELEVPRLYTILVTVGFFVSGIAAMFVSHGLDSHDVLIFPMNLPHGLLHVLIAGLGLFALRTGRELKFANWMALALTLLFLAGYLPQPLFGVLPVGGTDMFLHGVTGVLGEATVRIEAAGHKPLV